MTKYLDNEGLTHFTEKMKGYADGKAGEVDGKVTSHVGNKKNPHGVTKEQVGLSNVTNDKQIPLSQRGAVNGVATLDAGGKLTSTQIPTTKTINGQSIFGSGNITVSTSLYKIVDALPTKDIDISKIYLVPATTTADKNNKTEYIYLGDPSKAYDATKWEKLGEEQKNATIETPGGSIVVDTAFDTSSSNPIANKTVASKVNTIESTLNGKVAKGDYDTALTTVNSKLKALEDKTITTDSELSESSVNPIQTQAVYKAVQGLETKINGKADTTALTSATDRITTLEKNGATDVTESGEGNGIASIKKEGKNIVATKGKFITSLAGYATTSAMNTALAGKSDTGHTHSQYAETSVLADYALKSALDSYVTNSDLTQKNFATKGWIMEQNFAKTSAIPTKTSQITNDSGFLTEKSLEGYVNSVEVPATDMMVQDGHAVAIMRKNGSKIEYTLKPFFNTLDVEDTANKDGNGIIEISTDPTRKYKLHVKKGKFITETTLGTSIDDYASKKGYLTKDSLKETITIKLVSDKSASDTNLNGATVTVKSGDTTVSTQTWQGTPIKVEVPCDRDVTIEVSAVKMYVKPKALTYIPSPLYNREVIFTYKAQETGVFIIDKNNKTYKTTEEFTQSGLPKTDIVGALLVTDKVAIVIVAQLFYEAKWSNKNGLIDGCTVNSNATIAAQDFAGAANTAAIIKANAGLDTAASKCNNYVLKNGKKGHLMSGGEAIEIQKNFNRINSVLEYINSSNTLDENRSYWTSTQKGSDTAWGIRMDDSTLFESYITLPGTSVMGTNAIFPIYSLYD